MQDPKGKVIAEGKPGEMISLPPGDYKLSMGHNSHDVLIESDRTTVFTLE